MKTFCGALCGENKIEIADALILWEDFFPHCNLFTYCAWEVAIAKSRTRRALKKLLTDDARVLIARAANAEVLENENEKGRS